MKALAIPTSKNRSLSPNLCRFGAKTTEMQLFHAKMNQNFAIIKQVSEVHNLGITGINVDRVLEKIAISEPESS